MKSNGHKNVIYTPSIPQTEKSFTELIMYASRTINCRLCRKWTWIEQKNSSSLNNMCNKNEIV